MMENFEHKILLWLCRAYLMKDQQNFSVLAVWPWSYSDTTLFFFFFFLNTRKITLKSTLSTKRIRAFDGTNDACWGCCHCCHRDRLGEVYTNRRESIIISHNERKINNSHRSYLFCHKISTLYHKRNDKKYMIMSVVET